MLFFALEVLPDQYIAEALDEFLINNKSVLLERATLCASRLTNRRGQAAQRLVSPRCPHTDTSTSNTDARTIARLLGLDFKEVLRTISRTCKRIPERKVLGQVQLEAQTTVTSVWKSCASFLRPRILRDRRVILEIMSLSLEQ